EAVERIIRRNGDKAKEMQVGFLALSKSGQYGAYCIQSGFNYAVHDRAGNRLFDSASHYKKG
ncbi:MAG: glycosylasparaginase, partial [Bacteroidota bacterium]